MKKKLSYSGATFLTIALIGLSARKKEAQKPMPKALDLLLAFTSGNKIAN